MFSVDITEGQPPLKLPFNVGDDPYFAAQKFIHKNELSQQFLDQIANFIIDNSKGATLSQGQSSSNYADPFTGNKKYKKLVFLRLYFCNSANY